MQPAKRHNANSQPEQYGAKPMQPHIVCQHRKQGAHRPEQDTVQGSLMDMHFYPPCACKQKLIQPKSGRRHAVHEYHLIEIPAVHLRNSLKNRPYKHKAQGLHQDRCRHPQNKIALIGHRCLYAPDHAIRIQPKIEPQTFSPH